MNLIHLIYTVSALLCGLQPTRAESSTFLDCNGNNIDDAQDLAGGGSRDLNRNAVPDECDAPDDYDGNGDVDLRDFAAFATCLTNASDQQSCDPPLYGEARCHTFDFDGNGDVTLSDFFGFHASLVGGAPYKLYGLDFGPYVDGQDPNRGAWVREEQLLSRMRIVADYTDWIRTFGCSRGLEAAGRVAHGLGLKAAVGVWLSTNTTANDVEINNLIAVAQAGEADVVIVGSEVLLRRDLTEAQLISYINRVRAAVPGNIPVTTADAYSVFLEHPALVAAIDILFVNYYPFWEGVSIDTAVAAIHCWHDQVIDAAGGKRVVVSETGWPSCGTRVGSAVPSPESARFYALNFVSWAQSLNVDYFYFEALDESWKAAYEGPQGACWGIWKKDGHLKSGMLDLFRGATVPDNWSAPGGPGDPEIEFVSVPPYGSFDNLKGQVWRAAPLSHSVAVYIFVGSGWWTKPYCSSPSTPIRCDGTWICDITTGGADQTATRIAAFLLPEGYDPPLMYGGPTLPPELEQNALATVEVERAP